MIDRICAVTVIVPVLNEAGNINELTDRLLATCNKASIGVEILFIDGGSNDGTQDRVRERMRDAPVRLLPQQDNFRGLAGAVVTGAREAKTPVVVIMDGDLSHPPEMVPALAAPLLNQSCDMAIGSRYVAGGRITGWSRIRQAVSYLVTLLTRLLIDVKDPMSGFFAVERDRLINSTSDVKGYKILFEIIAIAGGRLRVLELPIEFIERQNGHSKATFKVGWIFLRQWVTLAGGRFANSTAFIAGTILDILVFLALFRTHSSLNAAQLAAIGASWAIQFFVRSRAARSMTALSVIKSLMVFLLALFLRAGTLESLVRSLACPPPLAIIAVALLSSAIMELGHSFFVFTDPLNTIPPSRQWRVAAMGLFAYIVALRLAYMGLPNLNPQEAYYWNYSKHLDLSYLDHPPMTAWLIAAGAKVFGDCEFGVRVGGFLCWIATVGFGCALTRNIFGKDAAFRSVIVTSITPFFLSFFMTPDAPLTACWTAALFFFERALLGRRRAAFWGIGLCIGLGVLSKYTIVLLGLAAVLYLIVDKPARRWIKVIDVALVPLIALILFTPVIVWNANHHWASFHFQSTRRLSEAGRFSLPYLSGGILLLLTPTVLLGVLLALVRRKPDTSAEPQEASIDPRWLFGTVFTLVPVSVFFVFSFIHPTKPEWTGPIWLALLPAISFNMLASPLRHETDWRFKLNFSLWQPTAWLLSLIIGGVLFYVSIGIPNVGYGVRHFPIGWDELGKQIESVENSVESATGKEPLVVGADQYYIASEVAFYRSKIESQTRVRHCEAVGNTTSWQIFGNDGLMYGYWFNDLSIGERPVILIGYKPDELNRKNIVRQFQSLDPVVMLETFRGTQLTHRFYYRICHGYHMTVAKE